MEVYGNLTELNIGIEQSKSRGELGQITFIPRDDWQNNGRYGKYWKEMKIREMVFFFFLINK